MKGGLKGMQKNVLVVDDDEDLSYIISDMLESYGYNVLIAENVKCFAP